MHRPSAALPGIVAVNDLNGQHASQRTVRRSSIWPLIICADRTTLCNLRALTLQAATAGTAASGVVVALLRVIAKAAGGATYETLRAATTAYFAIAIATCTLTVLLYARGLRRLPLYQRCIKQAQMADLHAVCTSLCASGCLHPLHII